MAEEIESSALGDLLGVTESASTPPTRCRSAAATSGAMRRAARRPWRSVPAWLRYGAGLGLTGAQLVTRAAGVHLPEVVQPEPGDARFHDPTWNDNIVFHGGLQVYLLTARLLHELVEAAGLAVARGPEGRVRRDAARRRAVAHQPAVHESARTQARVRDRRHERGAGRAELRARPAAQRRLAAPGRPQLVRARAEHRGHARARSCSATISSR